METGVTETGWAYVVGDDGNQGSHVGQTVGQITPSNFVISYRIFCNCDLLTGFTIYDTMTVVVVVQF